MSRRRYAFREWAEPAGGKWVSRETYNAYQRAYMQRTRPSRAKRMSKAEIASAIVTGLLL